MRNFFVPYSEGLPATVTINGHTFIFLSHEREILEESLALVGGDHLEEMSVYNSQEEDQVLDTLAREIDGGIVIAPTDVAIEDLIANLEAELPWVH